MQFANSNMFWLLLCVIIAFLIGRKTYRGRKQNLSTFAELTLLPELAAGFDNWQAVYRRAPWWSAMIVLCLVITLLRPQWGFTWEKSTKRGVDIVIAVDLSESMNAEDVSPNRLTRAKREILDLLGRLKGDRVALVAFAGTAFLEMPLTLDYGAFRLFLSSLSTELIPIKGTNIEGAITESIKAFRKSSSIPESAVKKTTRERAVVLITDGENFEGDLLEVSQRAKENHVRIFIVGIGSPEGAPIPTDKGHKKDKGGRVIITKLRQDALKTLAQQTGGLYVKSITSDRDVMAIYDLGIHKSLEATVLAWDRSKRWNEYFQLPLFLAVLLLILGPWANLPSLFVRSERPGYIETKKKKWGQRSLVVFLLPAVLSLFPLESASAQSSESLGLSAKQAFDDGNFREALHGFTKAEKKNKSDYRLKIGRAASFYRLNRFHQAKALFFQAAADTEDKTAKAGALYNAANSMVQLGELEGAIKTYEDSLTLVPEDKEAQNNLEYAKRLLQQQQKVNRQESKKKKQTGQKKTASGKTKQQHSAQNQQGRKGQNRTKDKKKKKDQEKQENQKQKTGDGKQSEQKENKERHPDEKLSKEEEEKKAPKNSSDKERDKSADSEQTDPSEKERGKGTERKESSQDQQKQRDDSLDPRNKDGEPEDGQHQGPPTVEDTAKELDQRRAQFESVEEKTAARMKYRLRRGIQQLEEQKRKLPEKDW